MTTGDKIIRDETSRDDSSLSYRFKYLHNYIKKILSTIIFAMICIPVNSWAACSWNGNTGTVASPYAQSDLSACISDASGKTGNVLIQIPNCSVSYSSAVGINMRSGFTNVTALTIRGQNDCTLDGSERPTSCGTNIANFGVNYLGKEGKAFRVAHMTITGSSNTTIDGDGKSWRFDHIFYNGVTSSNRINYINRSTAGWVTNGLYDHLYILNPSKGFLHYQPSADGGNLEWMNPLGLGTADAFYLESSKIYFADFNPSAPFTDSNGPLKMVFRYNEMTNGYVSAHDAIVINYRGARKWEIYGNVFTCTDIDGCFAFAGRCGSGVIFNNTMTTSGQGYFFGVAGIQFGVWRTYTTGGDPWNNLCSNSSGKAILDTITTYPQTCTSGTGCINKDGSSSSPNGWPCRDQLGASGNSPQVGGGQPFLIWNNNINGNYNAPPYLNGTASYILSGRDYCYHSTTMPSSCNGVTTTYTPYQYPHPLTQSMTSIINPINPPNPVPPVRKPSPPQNLK